MCSQASLAGMRLALAQRKKTVCIHGTISMVEVLCCQITLVVNRNDALIYRPVAGSFVCC